MFTVQQVREAVAASLTDELRLKKYQGDDPFKGHCYVASEAFYHLYRFLGDRQYIVDVRHMKWEGEPHWFCVLTNIKTFERGTVDITASQFKKTPDYRRAYVQSFLTVTPSERTKIVLVRATEILEKSRNSPENHLTSKAQ